MADEHDEPIRRLNRVVEKYNPLILASKHIHPLAGATLGIGFLVLSGLFMVYVTYAGVVSGSILFATLGSLGVLCSVLMLRLGEWGPVDVS